MDVPPPNYTNYPRQGNMMGGGMPSDPPGTYFEYIGKAFNMIKSKPDVFVLGTLIFMIMYGAIAGAESVIANMIAYGSPMGPASPGDLGLKATGISTALTILSAGVIYGFYNGFGLAAIEMEDTGTTSINTIFKGFNNFLQLSICSALFLLATYIGILFCIVPGVYVMGIFSFAPLFCANENLSAIEALKKSYAVSKPFAWGIFGISFVSYFVSGLGILLCCVGILFTMAIGPIVIGLHYRNFSRNS